MKHLSPEQISSVVAGIEVTDTAHLRECAACAEEVDRAKAVLMQFRGSVRDWTDRMTQPRVHGTYSRRRASMAWVLATAALAAAVAIPAYRESREQELKAQAQRDDQLLMDVNAQLSRNGPMAMYPLMRMMAPPDSELGMDSTKLRRRFGAQEYQKEQQDQRNWGSWGNGGEQ